MQEFNRNVNLYEWDEESLEGLSMVEYIWIDGTGKNVRSKTRVVEKNVKTIDDLNNWNYDGSSTEQASITDSEILLKPVFLCKDPFRKKSSFLALCETFQSDGETPARYNFRAVARKVFEAAAADRPWFGVEQEFYLYQRKGTTMKWPLGWPIDGLPWPQGKYYCSVGDEVAFGRSVMENFLKIGLSAGLKIGGINAENGPGQWEYQIGIVEGIRAADELWMSRYLIKRLGEQFGVYINLDPKPIPGNWSGSGCHINFSTEKTRGTNGLKYIIDSCMKKLQAKHGEHLQVYGDENNKRLIGAFETPSISMFDFGCGNRGASIRIPVETFSNQRGYFEDRRPASNMDPYLSLSMITDTVCLGSKYCPEILSSYKDSAKFVI